MMYTSGTAQGTGTRPGVILLVAALGNFLVSLALSPVSTILPTIARSLEAEIPDAGWAVSSYLIALTGFLLISGRMGDVFSHRRIFAAGLVIYLVSALGATVALTLPGLVAARVVQGIGSALITGNSFAIATAVVDERARGKAVGIVTMAFSVGALLGAVGAVGAVELVNWRWIFLVTLPLGVVGLLGVTRLPETRRTGVSARSLDYGGALLLFGALVAWPSRSPTPTRAPKPSRTAGTGTCPCISLPWRCWVPSCSSRRVTLAR